MLLDTWSVALLLGGAVVLFLMAIAVRSAVRVLLFWDPSSDGHRQIGLENEIWLTSTLVETALGVQILMLAVFVLAADHFSGSLTGAMCATGSLLANGFGVPALAVKVAGVFLYGFWIVLHQLDIRSEEYPLVRVKYVYLILLLPVLVLDLTLESLYLARLQPEIITSCCAVVFGGSTGGGTNLLAGLPHRTGMGLFYGTVLTLAAAGGVLLRRQRRWLELSYGAAWVWFFPLALYMITTEFSSYIYAMPFHKCPFCILQPAYHAVGVPIYLSLFLATFFGAGILPARAVRARPGVAAASDRYRRVAAALSLILLAFFTALVTYPYVRYLIAGGES